MRNTPGEPHVCSPEILPWTDDVSDVIDTCPHMEPDVGQAQKNRKVPRPTPAAPNTTYVITRSRTATTTTDTNLSAQ